MNYIKNYADISPGFYLQEFHHKSGKVIYHLAFKREKDRAWSDEMICPVYSDDICVAPVFGFWEYAKANFPVFVIHQK